MKVCLLILLGFVAFAVAQVTVSNPLNAPDLPGFTPNLRNIAAGSLIIPMDPYLQIRDPGTGLMSVLPYGLVIRTLYANVSVSWAIASGKVLNGADLSVQTAYSTYATIAAAGPSFNSWTNSAVRTFYGGPFIIQQVDVSKCLTAWNSWVTNPSAVFKSVDPSVYNTLNIHMIQANVLVDIRHTIYTHPYIAVSNLDGNAATQTAMLGCLYSNKTRACPVEGGSGWGGIFGYGTAGCKAFQPQDHAGLEFGIHYQSYDCGSQVAALTSTTCLTTFSEPHWQWITANGPSYISAMEAFVYSGANFFAQCASITSYEDQANTNGVGTFMTKYGVESYYPTEGWQASSTLTNYPDLPICQYVNEMSTSITGQVPDFYALFGTNNDQPPSGWNAATTFPNSQGYNDFNPVSFPLVTNIGSASTDNDYDNILHGRNTYVAAGSKYANIPLGANIWYLGGHTWAGQSVAGTENGRRFFFNAIVIPAARPPQCGFTFCTAGQACDGYNYCTSCTCDPTGSGFIYANITGCCISNANCTAPCTQCNTNTHACELIPGCCNNAINCSACETCSSTTSAAGSCSATPGCCTTNSGCTVSPCINCVNEACVTTPEPQCCDTSLNANACKQYACQTCTDNACARIQPLSDCCLTNQDCAAGPCKACDNTTHTCYDVPGCCNVTADCGTSACVTCSNNQCVSIPDCCEVVNSTTQCAACEVCGSNHKCVASPDPNCCTSDAQCGSCRRCAPGANNAKTCVGISDCCLTSADCETCSNCSNSQCVPIQGCCVFDTDCEGCDICSSNYTCLPHLSLDCCLSDNDCELAREQMEQNPNNTNIPGCDLICNFQAAQRGNGTGVCQSVCSSGTDWTGLIVGLAAGVPLGLLCLAAIAAALIAFLLWKRDALTGAFLNKGPDLGTSANTNPAFNNPVQVHNTNL
jgi:hypothetical protein